MSPLFVNRRFSMWHHMHAEVRLLLRDHTLAGSHAYRMYCSLWGKPDYTCISARNSACKIATWQVLARFIEWKERFQLLLVTSLCDLLSKIQPLETHTFFSELNVCAACGLLGKQELTKRVLMSRGYIRVLCMMSHYCVTDSNIWASLKPHS